MKLPKLADKYLCTGCLACVDVCPSSAITDTKGYDGHIYVHVDINKCIGCLKCERTCINIHDGSYSDNVKTSLSYAVVNKNKTFYENATSGGVFPAIASSFISDGGCVYGAAYIDGIHVKHIRISKISDIVLLQGSKYIQSNLRGIYRQITDDLKDGRKVLFTGTGCQVAGVLAYFKNNKNSELLYTMDLVCGGVPSSLLVETFAKHTKDFSSVISFRQKGQYVFSYKNRNGNEIVCKKALPLDGFKSCLTNRYSCYNCEFAGIRRMSDWTIGDYWGDTKDKQRSLCICHNKRAYDKLNSLSDVESEALLSWDFVKYNPRLVNGKAPFMNRLERRHIGFLFRNLSYKRLCKIYGSDVKKQDVFWFVYKIYKYVRFSIYYKMSKRNVIKILNL